MPDHERRPWLRYLRGLAVPIVLWVLVIATLREPLRLWLSGEEKYDEIVLQEWIQEARVFRQTLPEMVEGYLLQMKLYREVAREPSLKREEARQKLAIKRGEIQEHLDALGNPLTKMYGNVMPLFPIIYRMEVRLTDEPESEWIVWDSELPHSAAQAQEMEMTLLPRAQLYLRYQLHAYNRQQKNEQLAAQRRRWVLGLAVAGTALVLLWMYMVQHRRLDLARQRAMTQEQIDRVERLRLEEKLRRTEAEGRQEETERKLLEQQLATQAAERQALELKSQLYASIGIMAGSYAHNIKNLLLRPNDLLRRCLDGDGLSSSQEQMIDEVRQTLGTVTERLQQILRTVRRDPSRSEMARLNLNDLVAELARTWKDLAHEKWKLTIGTDLPVEPLWIDGDLSHLQQTIENLIFNARDATFEMRTYLREQAHRASNLDGELRRQALISAAAWRGTIILRTRHEGNVAVVEVQDNGIGMTEEVRRHCTETHFSTKRDNAIYEGNSTGMGLGLSFVVAILEHHQATLAIDSQPLEGTNFRIRFPKLH